MTFAETLAWQRANAHKINYLAKQGDPLALRLVDAYRELYGRQLDPALQANWMAICDDYVRRSLTLSTRAILQERFGVHIPDGNARLRLQ